MEDIHSFFNDLRDEGLSPSERSLIRTRLLAFIKEHPARAPLMARVRWFIRENFTAVRLAPRWQPAALALLLALTGGVGTSYAAESALPGDPLYGIKIGINEPIRGAFAVTAQQKASWDAQLASRRLQETETLAADGKLTAQNEQLVENELAATAKNFDDTMASLSQSQGSAPSVVAAQSQFEATLTAHEQVLAGLAQALPSARPVLTPITVAVATRAEGEAQQRQLAERALNVDKGAKLKDVAIAQQNAAEDSIAGIRVLAENDAQPQGKLVASSTTQSAEAAIAAGNDALQHSDYGRAFDSFQTAVRESDEAQMALQAQTHLKVALPILPGAAIDGAESSTTAASSSPDTSASTTASSTEQ